MRLFRVFLEHPSYIDFCRKNAKCQTYHFKGLHTLQVVKIKVKSHKTFEATTLRRQRIAEYENIIKCSNPKIQKLILKFLLDVQLGLFQEWWSVL